MPKTVVGLFTNEGAAQHAVRELLASGVAREDIGVTSRNYTGGGAADATDTDESLGDKIGNFFGSLFGANDERTGQYAEAVRGGGTVITVDAPTEELAARAAAILDKDGEVDMNERDMKSRAAMGEGGETVLPVIEEELQVGKREVESGGVRVRSHVIERPVEESVRLREERVSVERRPVNRAVDDSYLNTFREGTIEVAETAEVAVVSKQARVVEEVVVNKEVGERTETVTDTLRRTDVEVEQLGTDETRRNAKRTGSE